MLFAIRIPQVSWHQNFLEKKCRELVEKKTPYSRGAIDPPRAADCVTAINYVMGRILPSHRIGNMPRVMHESGFEVVQVETSELKTGDLLFVKNKEYLETLVSHVGVVVGKKIFHCSKQRNTVVLEEIDSFFRTYDQVGQIDALLNYKDRRGTDPLPLLSQGFCQTSEPEYRSRQVM